MHGQVANRKKTTVRYHVRDFDVAVGVDDGIARSRDRKQIGDIDSYCDRKHEVKRIDVNAVRLVTSQDKNAARERDRSGSRLWSQKLTAATKFNS